MSADIAPGKSLRIAVIAHIRQPIAYPFMGGMEAYTHGLVEHLVRRGHEVTLFASGDSDTSARLVPIIPVHYEKILPWHKFHGTEIFDEFLGNAFQQLDAHLLPGTFDVIHNNSLHSHPMDLAQLRNLPIVTSLHVPPFKRLKASVDRAMRIGQQATVTSAVQAARWWPNGQPEGAHVVHNGIDLAQWPFRAEGDGSAIWFGRITPTKGTHLALKAAAKMGLRLRLYGPIEHDTYFTREVSPLLSDRLAYEGHLAPAALARQLPRASVCLFTPLWDEPFGLAAVEAMACGVPVAATNYGAVGEVIQQGGVVAADNSIGAFCHAIREACTLDRHAVSRYATTRFSRSKMVSQLEEIYHAAMTNQMSQTAHNGPPPRMAEPKALAG